MSVVNELEWPLLGMILCAVSDMLLGLAISDDETVCESVCNAEPIATCWDNTSALCGTVLNN